MLDLALLGSADIEQLDTQQLKTAFSLQRALVGAAVDGIIAIDRHGIIQLFNAGAEALFGYQACEVIGRNVSCLMPEPFAARHDSYMHNYQRTNEPKIIGIGRDVLGLKSNGETFPLHLSVGCADTAEGRFFVGICHDLTNYKNALLKLHAAEQRYREIVESQTELIMRIDSDLRLTFINPALCQFFNCGEGARLLGDSLLEQIHADDRVLVKRQFSELRNGQGEVETLRVRMIRGDNDIRWVEWRVRPLVDGEYLGSWEFQGFGVDVTEELRAKEQVAYVATHDSVTGLLNRKGFSEALSTRLKAGERNFSVVVLNLDCFDIINETLNHAAGDCALKLAAERIRGSIAKTDVCARLNADEFIVMLNDTSRAEHVQGVVQRLQGRLAENYLIDEREFHLTACAGITLCPAKGASAETLMRRAQTALREAKSRGRHEMVFFTPALEERTKTAAELELGIRQALDEARFELAYQPKYRLRDSELDGFEVLIRWFHPEWGDVSPARFIPFAESNGLIVSIGKWVFEHACKQWRAWTDAGFEVPQIAVNISTRQLESWGFKETLLDTLANYAMPASAIELEITEGAALTQTEEQMELIRQLRAEGFSIAIDDFGTGYSSLSHLSTLPASTLKIDRAFVSKIVPGIAQEPVIEAIIALGHSLGMQVVAEGVETEAQRQFLREKGCDIGQGYLYSRPLKAVDVLALMPVRQPMCRQA